MSYPLDRRRFLMGSGSALALPRLASLDRRDTRRERPKRLVCLYMPDGVPMPLRDDPAFGDWSWFPHGGREDFRLTKCLEPLEPLRRQMTIVSGMSHPAVRAYHGHSNADQFLTGADTGARGEYRNSVSMDQVFAAAVGDQTRFASLVMSTDGGTGTPRGAHTMSYDAGGKAIPAEHRPKQIFDGLFVSRDADAARRLALDEDALGDLLAEARRLHGSLSAADRAQLEEYLDSVRDTERRVQKAKRWIDVPLPAVDADPLDLDVTPDDARNYVRTMYELIHLALVTDSTRVVTYQIGRENSVGISDRLGRAVGFPLAHQLSHETKKPGGWKNFGLYCRFLAEELGRFVRRLQDTEEPGGEGSMLDNTVVLFGSASSAFHLSRNYPVLLLGGMNMGFRHGQFLDYLRGEAFGGAWTGGREPWQQDFEHEDRPFGELLITVLRRLGVSIEAFAGCTESIREL